MRISELAKESGLSIDTIRFYEKQELLNEQHFERLENNYRSYNAAALERLKMIKCAQETGFTLSEIKVMMDDVAANGISDEQRKALLEKKLKQMDEQVKEIETMRTYLRERLEMPEGQAST